MTAQGNGEPVVFRVILASQTSTLVKKLHAEAAKAGKGGDFVRALHLIHERLRADPWRFGEPLYRLPALKLQVRHGSVGGVVVIYGVHEERPLVFIRGFTQLG